MTPKELGADYGGAVIFADVINVKHILNGTCSAMVITSLRPALIASMALCFVNLAGTKMTVAFAPVFSTASLTVLNTERREPPVRPFGGDSAHNLGAVGQHLLGVEGALSSGDALNEQSCVFIYQYAHYCAPPFTIASTPEISPSA